MCEVVGANLCPTFFCGAFECGFIVGSKYAKRCDVVVGDVAAAHEALDVALDWLWEGNLPVVGVIGNAAATPSTVPEGAGVITEDVAEAAFRRFCPGAAELLGRSDEACAALCEVGVVFCLRNSFFGFGNGILEHGDEQFVVLDGSVCVNKRLYFFVADGLQNPLAGSGSCCPSDDVAGLACAAAVSVAMHVGIVTARAGLHGHYNLAFFGALDVFKEHFRLAVFGQGGLGALGTGGHDAVGGDVHHLDEACLWIVGHLPKVAAVGAVDVCPHGFALEGGVHGLDGMGDDFLVDGLVVFVVFACCDALSVRPLQGADDAVVSVGDGEPYEGLHDGGIAGFNLFDDVVNLLDGDIRNFFREDLERQIHVLDEGVEVLVAVVVLANSVATKFVNGMAAVVGQVILIDVETGVETCECNCEVVHAFYNRFENGQTT